MHAEKVNKTSYKNREVSLFITVGVKNTFNTANWSKIIEQVKRKRVARHIVDILQEYLADMKLKLSTKIDMTMCGVP